MGCSAGARMQQPPSGVQTVVCRSMGMRQFLYSYDRVGMKSHKSALDATSMHDSVSIRGKSTFVAVRDRKLGVKTYASAMGDGGLSTLTQRLGKAWKMVQKDGRLTKDNMKEPLKEVRRALLEADVSLPVVRRFVKRVEEEAMGMEVIEGVSPEQQLIKAVYDQLKELMGGEQAVLNTAPGGDPQVILMAGLQGTGKTTACGKLARYLNQTKGQKVLLVATDVYRPAAIDQLVKLGQSIDVPVFELGVDVKPPEIAAQGIAKGKQEGYDVVIVDTAGRLQIDEMMMQELKDIKEKVSPTDVLLVVDAMTGQEAASLVKSFDETVSITGAILTKTDGDTRGGAALSVKEVSGRPIKFSGTGEKMGDLEPFYPDRMASRILGRFVTIDLGVVVVLVAQLSCQLDALCIN